MKYLCGIYQLRNLEDNNVYIGQTINLQKRKNRHFSDLQRNEHYNNHLQRSYNKYGKENFVFEILLFCESFELTRYEQFFVDNADNKYNLLIDCVDSAIGYKWSTESRMAFSGSCNPNFGKSGSETSMYGVSGSSHQNYGTHWSDERRELMISKVSGSCSYLYGTKGNTYGKKRTEETIKKMSEHMKGIPKSEEHKNNISIATSGSSHWNYGGHLSEETKNKISNSHKGRRGIILISKETVLLTKEMFSDNVNITDIHRKLNISKNTVYKIIRGFYDEYYDL
jgi:group I intron endonuclease